MTTIFGRYRLASRFRKLRILIKYQPAASSRKAKFFLPNPIAKHETKIQKVLLKQICIYVSMHTYIFTYLCKKRVFNSYTYVCIY